MGTLAAPAARYLVERRSRGEISRTHARAIAYTLQSLDKSFGERQLSTFGARAVERWSEQNPQLKPSTRATYLSHIRQFCQWMLRRKLIRTDPFTEVKLPRRPRPAPRPLPRSDIQRLLSCCPDARARLIVLLMFSVGLRCIGISRLKVEDIDLAKRVLHVTEKGGHERRLPLTNDLIGEIDRFMFETRPGTSGPLFRNYRQPWRPLGAPYISALVARWMRAAGVKSHGWDGRGAHALRHSALTETAEAGADVWTLQELAGWSSPSTAAFYVRRATTERVREALERRDAVSDAGARVPSGVQRPPGKAGETRRDTTTV